MTLGRTPRNAEVTYVDCLVQSVPWKQASGPWLRGVFRPDKLASEGVLRRFGRGKRKLISGQTVMNGSRQLGAG